MATSSILGGTVAEQRPDGFDIDHLGPSDSSDSGSDVQSLGLPSDTDAAGTGERPSVEPGMQSEGEDILPDRIGDSVEGADGLRVDSNIDVDSLAADEDDEEEDEDA